MFGACIVFFPSFGLGVGDQPALLFGPLFFQNWQFFVGRPRWNFDDRILLIEATVPLLAEPRERFVIVAARCDFNDVRRLRLGPHGGFQPGNA
jgi:hypothetical protein